MYVEKTIILPIHTKEYLKNGYTQTYIIKIIIYMKYTKNV